MECVADKVCGFADGCLIWCEKNEGSDDFRSKQLVVNHLQKCQNLQEKFGEANQMTTFGCVEIPLNHSGEDREEAIR